jgi:hypothetical protein
MRQLPSIRQAEVVYIDEEQTTQSLPHTIRLVVERDPLPPVRRRRTSLYRENLRRQNRAGCFMVPFWAGAFALAALMFAVDDSDWLIKRGAAALAILFATGAVSFTAVSFWYQIEQIIGMLWHGGEYFDEF